ncbi:MAG TPA: hypothetical protein VKA00_09155 [Trueperaceae bacterium]|nr:hypothetical protein [Trueperaceae bacterium]
MLTLRQLDGPGLRAYLDEVRPRMLVVRVRARRVRVAWLVPLWPFEQLVAFAAGAALLAHAVWPLWTAAAGGQRSGVRARVAEVAGVAGLPPAEARTTLAALAASLSAIAGGHLGDVLRLPPGVPYVRVRSQEATVDVTAY